jgi:predicted ATPase
VWVIEHLFIDGFKSLRNISLAPAALNVLVGPNGSGKSSVLQTLLLLRQSADLQYGSIDSLQLSGELYEAGMPLDAIHPAANHTIEIRIKDNLFSEFSARFVNDRSDIVAENSRTLKAPSFFQLFSRTSGFAYLNAERIGPRVTSGLPLSGEGLDGKVGKHGQFTAAVLARAFDNQEQVKDWDDQTASNFRNGLSALDGQALIEQLDASQGSLFRLSNIMLGWIVPGAEFIATEHADTDSTVLAFTRDAHGTKTKTRATHVGFGLSYALPIIVAALSLSTDGLLLVENPEAHLHPYSQSRMGAFLALMASANRQIFAETHSDHVVNGIRLAVGYGLLGPENVRIYFFHNTLAAEQSIVSEITVDARGGLTTWPPGCFDQIEQDLARL